MVSQWHPNGEPMSRTCLVCLFWMFLIILDYDMNEVDVWLILKTRSNSSVSSRTSETRAHNHTDSLESLFIVQNECDSPYFGGLSGLGKLKGINFCKFFLTLERLKPSFALNSFVFTLLSIYSSSNTLSQPSPFLRKLSIISFHIENF